MPYRLALPRSLTAPELIVLLAVVSALLLALAAQLLAGMGLPASEELLERLPRLPGLHGIATVGPSRPGSGNLAAPVPAPAAEPARASRRG